MKVRLKVQLEIEVPEQEEACDLFYKACEDYGIKIVKLEQWETPQFSQN